MFANKFQALDKKLEEMKQRDVDAQKRASEQHAKNRVAREKYVHVVNTVIIPTVEDFARYAKQKHQKIIKYEIQTGYGFDAVKIFQGYVTGPSLTFTHHPDRTNLVVSARDIDDPAVAFEDVTPEWLIEKMIAALF